MKEVKKYFPKILTPDHVSIKEIHLDPLNEKLTVEVFSENSLSQEVFSAVVSFTNVLFVGWFHDESVMTQDFREFKFDVVPMSFLSEIIGGNKIQEIIDSGGFMYEDRYSNAKHFILGSDDLIEVISSSEPTVNVQKEYIE